MIKLMSLETAQFSNAGITVSWKFESSTEDFNLYRLSVLKSEAPSDDLTQYDTLVSGINPANTPSYLDTSVAGITSKFVDYFYRLVVSGLSGQGSYVSDFQGISVAQDKYAAEIVRRRGIVLNLHSGTVIYLVKRRTYGTVCPVSYDPVLQRTTSSGCEVCYDTGYVNGYFTPIPLRCQINERPTRTMYQMFSDWQDQDAVLYLQPDHPVNPKDIIVDKLFRRWVVITVGQAQKGVTPIGLTIQMRQIERADVIYKLPIDFTAKPK